MNTTYRLVQTPEDWSSAANLRNQVRPENPLTPEELQNSSLGRPEWAKIERYIMVVDGVDVGYGVINDPFWFHSRDRLEIVIVCPEAEHFESFFDFLFDRGVELGANQLGAMTFTTRPWEVSHIESRGFTLVQRNCESAVDLTEFDPKDHLAPLTPSMRILSLPELAEEYPDTWKQMAWRIEMDLMSDVPLPEPFKEEPFEDWVVGLESPTAQNEASFVLLDGDKLIATCQLVPNLLDPSLSNTGLTGVLPEYRRKGLARAIKSHVLQWGKARGIRQIWTDNEENNPMYQLNLELGYRKKFDWLFYSLTDVQSLAK
jgi:GNAT superfamily N-acetyltransferase